LRRCGRYGLFFIDGHADFYQPQASTTGEVADMDTPADLQNTKCLCQQIRLLLNHL
jgi:hypothetical protein